MIDFLLHVDERLVAIANAAGPWAYVVLFAIVFAETGLVVTPFLPGDSLLFAAGALSATGVFRIEVLVPTLILAAVTGNTVNYSVGARVAHRFLGATSTPTPGLLARLVKPSHVAEAHAFFVKHGGKAVMLAQFMPIVRTFLPFVAGGAEMPYRQFLLFNASGAVTWVSICAGAGYAFGNIPVVKNNFEVVVLGIVGVSLLPLLIEMVTASTPPSERDLGGRFLVDGRSKDVPHPGGKFAHRIRGGLVCGLDDDRRMYDQRDIAWPRGQFPLAHDEAAAHDR